MSDDGSTGMLSIMGIDYASSFVFIPLCLTDINNHNVSDLAYTLLNK
jgi:hypothetical protein